MIKIVEVGPRDGLQNEKTILPTDVKLTFIQQLLVSGVKTIEVTSFVSPKWVPQMADHSEVIKNLNIDDTIKSISLVPNEKGLENAIQAGAKAIAVFAAASETFSQKNINCSIDQSIENFKRVID